MTRSDSDETTQLMKSLVSRTVMDIESLGSEAVNQLAPFKAKTADLPGLTEFDAPVFLKEMTSGIFLATELQSRLAYLEQKAVTDRKRIEALCGLEKFPVWAKERGVKGTNDERTLFISLQQEVVSARECEAQLGSLLLYVSGVKFALISTHDDCRKIHYSGHQSRQDFGKVFS